MCTFAACSNADLNVTQMNLLQQEHNITIQTEIQGIACLRDQTSGHPAGSQASICQKAELLLHRRPQTNAIFLKIVQHVDGSENEASSIPSADCNMCHHTNANNDPSRDLAGCFGNSKGYIGLTKTTKIVDFGINYKVTKTTILGTFGLL